MSKSKFMILGLIGLLLLIGLVLAACANPNENCVGNGNCYIKKVSGGTNFFQYEKDSYKDCEMKCTRKQAGKSSSSYKSFSCNC